MLGCSDKHLRVLNYHTHVGTRMMKRILVKLEKYAEALNHDQGEQYRHTHSSTSNRIRDLVKNAHLVVVGTRIEAQNNAKHTHQHTQQETSLIHT